MGRNETYEEFVEKFKPKKTTDDCYTPPEVYETVAKFVEREYKQDRSKFCRPFYPGGDYENCNYSGKIVVDNPPFSILSKILKFYAAHGVPYFLFAPALTVFGTCAGTNATCIWGGRIIYENGARVNTVNTAFVTNMETGGIIARTVPELTMAIEEASKKLANQRIQNPKYKYPKNVLTSTMLEKMARNGITYNLHENDAVFIRALDEQRAVGKAMYGGGFLVSDRAAADIVNPIMIPIVITDDETISWELSEREEAIIEWMDKRKIQGD